MKKILLLLCGIIPLALAAQTSFPPISCETLNGKTVNIPQDTKGQKTVVVIAMSARADKDLQQWNTPLYNSLIADGMGGLMGGRMYNANLCFVGMLKGVAKMASKEVKDKAKKNTDKKLWDNYMITDKDVKEFIQAASINNTDEPYFFVLDKDGNIIYRTSGKYSDEKLDEITSHLM